MNREQYLLIKIAEEASEVAQIALKTAAFGLAECYNKGPSNADRIKQELNDLHAVVEMLNEEFAFGYCSDIGWTLYKQNKVNKYYSIATELGRVDA